MKWENGVGQVIMGPRRRETDVWIVEGYSHVQRVFWGMRIHLGWAKWADVIGV